VVRRGTGEEWGEQGRRKTLSVVSQDTSARPYNNNNKKKKKKKKKRRRKKKTKAKIETSEWR
jgi:hypothetical protein